MFHIYTDHWWRNPKHAVTTDATLVEVKSPKKPDGVVTSGPYNPSPSGYFQTVTGEVHDPETGQVVRADGEFYSPAGAYAVGQTVRVRWSKKRHAIEPHNSNTAPEDEQGQDAGGPALFGAGPSVGSTPLSGAGLSPDQTARVQAALGALGIGGTSSVQVIPMQAVGGGGQTDPIGQLERLAELRKSGALTDDEFEQQKHKLLGES